MTEAIFLPKNVAVCRLVLVRVDFTPSNQETDMPKNRVLAAVPDEATEKHAATIARAQMMEILRDRYVCEGWKLDEEAAARVLRYVRRRPGMRGELQRVECHAQANAESLIAAAWNQTSQTRLKCVAPPFSVTPNGGARPRLARSQHRGLPLFDCHGLQRKKRGCFGMICISARSSLATAM